ncbi:calcium-binding protein [Marinobacter sp. F4218]|uniref:calcium-binding protein n=1 Tax=Marinobacter sp. F4218 TaxID=2862868 RepID=UPI001E65C527|nr:calcium-binding protein [Marinobacter sp. F4218]
MTNKIESVYQGALLADAAYISFEGLYSESTGEIINDSATLEEFLKRGFTETQFDLFRERYHIVDHVQSNISGLSATLFIDTDNGNKPILAFRGTETTLKGGPADLVNDFMLSFGIGMQTPAQDSVMQQWLDAGHFGEESLTVVGHSLGGHLSLQAAASYDEYITDVITFNGAGLNPLEHLLISEGINESKLTRVVAEPGFEFTANDTYFQQYDDSPHRLFIQKQSLISNYETFSDLATGNHSMVHLVDTLSVMRLFEAVDPSASVEVIDAVLWQATDRVIESIIEKKEGDLSPNGESDLSSPDSAAISLNTVIKHLAFQLGVKVQGGIDAEGNTVYREVEGVNDAPVLYETLESIGDGFSILPLDSLDLAHIAAYEDSKRATAIRYALLEGASFAIGVPDDYAEGIFAPDSESYQFGEHPAGFWEDRADYYQYLMVRNANDLNDNDAVGEGDFVYADQGLSSERDANDQSRDNVLLHGDEVTSINWWDRVIIDNTATHDMVVFGGDETDQELSGGLKNDRIYGLGGDDTLKGGEGNDNLVGGTGNDTYRYRTGDGADKIFDDIGQLEINGEIVSSIDPIDGQPDAYTDGNHLFYVFPDSVIVLVNGSAEDKIQIFSSSQLSSFTNLVASTADTASVATIEAPSLENFGLSVTEPTTNSDSVGSIDIGTGHDVFIPTDGDTVSNWQAYHSGPTIGSAAPIIYNAALFDAGLFEPGVNPAWNFVGGAGNDRLNGATNDDVLLGQQGDDIASGATGSDSLYGEEGSDRLLGGDGADHLMGNHSEILVDMETGNELDRSMGELAGDSDYLDGGEGNDWLTAGSGSDVLRGRAGDDELYGGAGSDLVSGGEGADLVLGDSAGAIVTYTLTEDRRIETGRLTEPDVRYTLLKHITNVDPTGNYDDTIEGGAGNDVLIGEVGDDHISGGTGDDWIEGDKLNNPGRFGGSSGKGKHDGFLDTAGNWVDVAADDFAALDGAWHGDDTLFGGAGNDSIAGNGGHDTLYGGIGEDLLIGDDASLAPSFHGDDKLFGGSGNDELQGGSGQDRLEGGGDDDVLFGQAGDDILSGDSGTDELLGGEGNDVLDGGRGNDSLWGGAGDDRYVFEEGDGADALEDDEGNTYLRVAGSTSALSAYQSGNLMVLRYGAAGGTITFSTASFQAIADITTDDGASQSLSIATNNASISGTAGRDSITGGNRANALHGGGGNDALHGGSNNDQLFGDSGNDVLQGGEGDDWLEGGEGSDTYRFELGGGHDHIDAHDTTEGRSEILLLGAGITAEMVGFSRERDDLVVAIGDGTDRINIYNFFNSNDPTYRISSLRLDDGTEWTTADLLDQFPDTAPTPEGTIYGRAIADVINGTSNDDVILGLEGRDTLSGLEGNDTLNGGGFNDDLMGDDGNDILVGGLGQDRLYGGAGNDIYRYSFGDGSDEIYNGSYTAQFDTLEFAPGIVPDQIHAYRSGNDLFLDIGDSGDRIKIASHFGEGGYGQPIHRILFMEDGSEWDASRIRQESLVGSDSWDNLEGFSSDDTIDGQAGHDFIDGLGGDDTLIGGAGDDQLRGSEGNDTYRFSLGGGNDIIDNRDTSGGFDTVLFDESVLPTDLKLQRDPGYPADDLVIRNIKSGENIIVTEHFGGPETAIDSIQFSDGTTWDLAMIMNMVNETTELDDKVYFDSEADIVFGLAGDDLIAGGAGKDTLYGDGGSDELLGEEDNDFLFGGKGDDRLEGGSGNDTLTGGHGNDRLEGGDGSDIYRYAIGDGQDVIDNSYSTDGENVLEFGEGIAASDVSLRRKGSDLLVNLPGAGDGIRVDSHFFMSAWAIDEIRFDDGTVWNSEEINAGVLLPTDGSDELHGGQLSDAIQGLAGDDQIFGNDGDDSLDGGSGADRIYGGHGDDIIRTGSGRDEVSLGQGSDQVFFDITQGSLKLSNVAEDMATDQLVIEGVSSTEALHFYQENNNLVAVVDGSYRPSLKIRNQFTSAGPSVDQIFVNGEVAETTPAGVFINLANSSASDLSWLEYCSARPSDHNSPHYVSYTDGSREVGATDGNDLVIASSNGSRLYGYAGDDILFGGSGDDRLVGAGGNDSYYLDADGGSDYVADSEGVDTLVLGKGIALTDLDIVSAGSASSIRQTLFLGEDQKVEFGTSDSIEWVEFADGSRLAWSDVKANIESRNQSPDVVSPVSDQDILEDTNWSFEIPLSSFRDQDSHDVLTYSASMADGSSLPGGLEFFSNESGIGPNQPTLSWSPANEDVGTYLIQVTATDSHGASVNSVFELAVVNVNDAPVVQVELQDMSATAGQAIDFNISADSFIDEDLGDQLTYSAMLAGGSSLPEWLVFDSSSGYFTGVPASDGAETLDIMVTATDLAGANASSTFTLTVNGPDEGHDSAGGADASPSEPEPGLGGDDQIQGDGRKEILIGGSGNDELLGNGGDDLLLGGLGNDSYIYTNGQDVVDESGGTDILRFSGGITFTQVASGLMKSGDDLILRIDGGPDQVTVKDFFIGGDAIIETLEFETGGQITSGQIYGAFGLSEPTPVAGWSETISGTSIDDSDLIGTQDADFIQGFNGNDVLDGQGAADRLVGGNGNDTLSGGTGNDLLLGGRGNDTYLFSKGEGQDTINNTGGGYDILRFEDITFSEVASGLMKYGDNLVLQASGGSDTVTLENFFLGGDNAIDRIEFGPGGEITADQVFGAFGLINPDPQGSPDYQGLPDERGFGSVTAGTAGGEVILASSDADFIDAGAGYDSIYGNLGNDYLLGGEGADTYHFGVGDGVDTINNLSNSSDPDNLRFSGIDESELWFSRQGEDLVADVLGTDDRVKVQGWYSGSALKIDSLATDDAVISASQLEQLVSAMAAFGATSGGEITLTPEEETQAQAVIASSWQSAA